MIISRSFQRMCDNVTVLLFLSACETVSQVTLSAEERAEINVRTKAPELIGRLSIVLWIYCNGMFE